MHAGRHRCPSCSQVFDLGDWCMVGGVHWGKALSGCEFCQLRLRLTLTDASSAPYTRPGHTRGWKDLPHPWRRI